MEARTVKTHCPRLLFALTHFMNSSTAFSNEISFLSGTDASLAFENGGTLNGRDLPATVRLMPLANPDPVSVL
jgi:hypothetical protein